MINRVSRRRFITIAAACAGLPLVAGPSRASVGQQAAVIWRGQALGAPATLVLNHEDRAEAENLIRRVVAEVSRLERIFSLYREDSAVYELNRTGGLMAPPPELVELLQTCLHFHRLSAGAFDPTVQPLWLLYARHFARENADQAGPPASRVWQVLSRIGFENVYFDQNRIAFARRGMAMTLNGIAQGYITDRIVALLRGTGITSSLVNMGESRAIGARDDGAPWRVGLSATEDAPSPDAVLELVDKAVATSGNAGFNFDEAARFSHILDPRSGVTAQLYQRVSVVAPDATSADALSTTLSLMPPQEARGIMSKIPSVSADMVLSGGERLKI